VFPSLLSKIIAAGVLFSGQVSIASSNCRLGKFTAVVRSLDPRNLIQNRALFKPGNSRRPVPTDILGDNERLFHFTSEGETIEGLIVPSTDPALKPTHVLFLGQTIGIEKYIHRIRRASQALNVNVVTINYQGFGGSTGRPSINSVKQNARDFWGWLQGQNEINKNDVLIHGISLGGIFAAHLASQADVVAKAVVIEAAPVSAAAAIRQKIKIPLTSRLFFSDDFNIADDLKEAQAKGMAVDLIYIENDEKIEWRVHGLALKEAGLNVSPYPVSSTTPAFKPDAESNHFAIPTILGDQYYRVFSSYFSP
jgi:dienelactone hydrolase